jgi:hypothetical protein
MEAKCKVINSNMYSSPHNKCMMNPSREREDPFLYSTRNQNKRNEK